MMVLGKKRSVLIKYSHLRSLVVRQQTLNLSMETYNAGSTPVGGNVCKSL